MAFASRLCRSVLVPASRLLIGQKVSCRSIFATRIMTEKQMEELKSNPYYEKYASKISQLQKVSPEEFLQRMSSSENARKTASSSKEVGGQFSMPAHPKASTGTGMSKEKQLDDYMKLDLLRDKSADEIAAIWKEYHVNRDAVAAVIPTETYEQMKQRFAQFKTFLFPLPRKQGYEFVVVQFDGNEAHLTTLINYQAYTVNAPECLTIVHYPDLAKEKGIVLMVGEFDKNILNVQEAQCLANQIEMYYCNPEEDKIKLLETFTQKPEEFKHQDLIAQLDTVNLLAK